MSSGYAHTPFIPDWPGRDRFGGQLMHAADYRNPEPFRDRDVLVVGPGCSGMEIAYDLIEGGAGRVRLAVRTPPNILIRSPIGPLFARGMLKLGPAPGRPHHALSGAREVGDLTEYGLPAPEEGIFSRLMRLGVAPAIVDKEVIEAIKERRIEIVAGVESLDDDGVVLADGAASSPRRSSPRPATAAASSPWSATSACSTSAACRSRPTGDEAAPGLRFIGYLPRPAHIGLIAREAT